MIIYSEDLEKKKILDSIKNIDISQKVCMYDFFSDDCKEDKCLCLRWKRVIKGKCLCVSTQSYKKYRFA